MAEAIVGPLLNKLQEVAVAEAKALAGVSQEIDRLRDKLMWLHAVVHETDLRSRHDGNPLVRVLACQMREVAFEAEDAIDRFYLQADLSRLNWRRAAAEFLANFGTHIRVRYVLSRKVRSMNARLDDIVDNSTKYSTDHGGSEAHGKITWRASCNIPPVRENWEDLELSEKSKPRASGRKVEEQKLEKHLLGEIKPNTLVICVVGEGGVGKRTLVRNALEKATVKNHFQVCIRESFPAGISNPSKLAENISSKLEHECSPLHVEVKQVRYLLVVDSPMSTTLWNKIGHKFPKRWEGSKIVLTATSWNQGINDSIIKLGNLNKDKSISLFNWKVGQRGRKPSNYKVGKMNMVRRRMEQMTSGLPLAVVLLAKLLRTMDLNKWEPASQYIMDNKDDRLKTIVSLCIDDLPDELKSCLLYTAGFRERSEIDASHLVRLWVAEGFLTPQCGVEPEEVGQRYLKELIFRGLVQLVKKRDQGQGDGVESVAIHDRIHPFFRSEAQRTCFMDIHYSDGRNVSAPDTARRLALLNSSPYFPEYIMWFKKLRTVVSQNSGRHNVDSTSATKESSPEEPSSKKTKEPNSFLRLLRGSPFLRVIDLEGLDIGDALPGEIGDMVHLQHIGVRGCLSLKTVPSSIGNLSKLQTLDVRGTSVTKLPRSFWKIAALRHVLGDQLLFPTSSGDLKLIQTLEKVVIASGSARRKSRLGLRLLHRLHVVELDGSRGQELGAVLDQLSFLESLILSGDPIPTDFLESATLQHLVSLELDGRLLVPPNMLDVDNVPNQLTHLVLSSTHVTQGFVDMLAKLPALADLAMLADSYDEEELVFRSDGHGFSSLTVLRLSHLPKLKTIKEEGGIALQKLVTFQQIGMPDLSLEGAPHLKSLLPTEE